MARRRALLATGGLLAVAAAWWILDDPSDPAYHSDVAAIETALPELGPLSDARWVSNQDDERSIPAPDVLLSGFARLEPGAVAELTAAEHFVAESPTVEEPLSDQTPEDADWVRSEAFDQALADDRSADYSGRLWFDEDSDTVYFTVLNPY